jgi:sec-independent protein translocase protein TatA
MGEGLFQPMHLLVILAIALLVFGPKRLPEIGKGLGGAIRGFKDVFKNGETTQAKPERKALPGTKSPGESSDKSKN